KLAFGGLAVMGEQRLGNDEPKHPVAEKFEPLVVGTAGQRRMRQRLDQQLGPAELVAEPGRSIGHGPSELQSTLTKKRSGRQVQKASIDDPADENTTRSARPTRFSNGTVPTPPAERGKRLSIELSRLSPMKKNSPSGTRTGWVLSPKPSSIFRT